MSDEAVVGLGPHDLDGVLGWVRDLVEGLTPWLPAWGRLLAASALVIALMWWLGVLLIRRLLPAVISPLGPLAGRAVTMAGLALLLPEFVLTSGWRRWRGRPPALSYWYGDTVAGATLWWAHAVQKVFSRAAALAGLSKLAVLALVLGGFVWWNGTYCEADRATARCTQPVSAWALSVKSWWAETQGAATKAKPTPKPKPKPKPTAKP